MYNEQLKIFIQSADCGSFSKAAEKLYLSATAVMKQINKLEEEIGVSLFTRTSHGVKLTEAGSSIYKDAKFMIKYSDDSIKRAREIAGKNQYIIKLGNSMLNPCKILIDLWNRISSRYPEFKMKIVPFNDEPAEVDKIYHTVGKDFDFIVGPYDMGNWKNSFNALEFGRNNLCSAVSRNHPLAAKSRLLPSELADESIMMVKPGTSCLIDQLREYIIKKYPSLRIIDGPSYYNIDVFNLCEQEKILLLTIDAWKDIHPSLVTIPVEWDFSLPYGIIYSLSPSKEVEKFIEIIKNNILEK